MEDSNLPRAQEGGRTNSISPSRILLNSPNMKSQQLQQEQAVAAAAASNFKGTLQNIGVINEMSPKQSLSNMRQIEETQVLNGQSIKFKKMFSPLAQQALSKKEEHIINGAILNLEHSFGFLNNVIEKNSHFISEDTLVFPSGRHLATLDLVSRRMDFIKREDSNYTSTVTCMQVGLSRKKELVVAIGEKSHGSTPRASIYIPSRLRWFRLDHDQDVLPQVTEESKIEQMYLPNYKKYCITVTRPQERGNLVVSYFRYEKEKVSRVSEIKPQVRRITISPKNHYHFLACGKSYLKMWDASDKVYKEMKDQMIPIKYERENDFIDAIFIQESIFVTVSAQNNFFIIENGVVKYYINISFSTKNSIRNLKSAVKQDGDKDSDMDGKDANNGLDLDDGTNSQISCVAAHKKGFVVGSKKGGYIGVYEIERDFSINHVDTFKVDPLCSEVTSVSISFDRQYLVINAKIMEENDHPRIQHGEHDDIEVTDRLEMYYLNLHQLSVLKNVFTLPIKPVFPKGNIVGSFLDMSVGVSKDLIVTVGEDKYIRVFEYAGSAHSIDSASSIQPAGGQNNQISVAGSLHSGSLNQISSHKPKEKVQCIAIHPMGLQLACGFKEKLKIYYLLEDEVKIAIDFQTKTCQSARYSNGGQYLAAANGNVIWIIDPYTFELKFQLYGHSSFVKILQWNESDSMLLSVCNNGSAYGWQTNFEIYQRDTKSQKKATDDSGNQASKVELILKSVKIHSIGYDEEFDLLYVSSSDNKLTLYSTEGGKGIKNYMQIYTGSDTELTSLLLSKQQSVLFAGTSRGSVRVYLWPIFKRKSASNNPLQASQAELSMTQNTMNSQQQQQSEHQIEFMEYFVHLGKIVSLSLSADKQSLITAGDDGTVYIQSIKEMCNGVDMNLNVSLIAASQSQQHQEILAKKKKAQNLNKCKVHLNMNQLSLVVRQAVEQKNSQIQELKYKVDNMKSLFQGELQNIADRKTQEINRLNEKNAKELEEEKQRYKSLQEEHENERNYLLKTIENNLEAHKKELKEINDDYQLKLKNAYKQHDKLVEAYEESKQNYKKELEMILDKNREALEQIEKEYRIKYEELQKNHIRLINDMKRDGEKFDVALEQCEQEYERELLKRREDFSTQMNKLSKNYDDLRESHEKLIRDRETMKKKLDDCDEIQFKLGSEQEQFHRKILDSNTRLVKMQEQLGEREEVIKSKEKSIKDLRNINTHLENFRFVLDHKIRSLKDEKLPMEQQINNLEKHIKQMYQELLDECEKKKDLMNKLKASEEKLEVLKKQLKQRQEEVVFTKRKLELLQYDLGGLIRNEALSDWPEKVSKLYEKHFEKRLGKKQEEQTSTLNNNDDMLSPARLEEESNIKEELIRQNNWMNTKLKSIIDKNSKLEKEKKDLYLKIQKENTELIKECNMLRASNQKISKKVLILEKKLKDISGISLSNANLVENQLEGFLKKAAPLSTKNKETPFVQIKKGGQNGNKRNQMLMDYYQQYALGQSQQVKPQEHNLDGLIGEMEKNQSQIQMQNFEIQQLQERVQQFLRQPSGNNHSSAGAQGMTSAGSMGMDESAQRLPPIQHNSSTMQFINQTPGVNGMMKSDSQPVIGLGISGADPSSLSMTLRKDDSNQKSLYKQPGMSTTMSHATLMTSQQLQNQYSVRKDSRQKQL